MTDRSQESADIDLPGYNLVRLLGAGGYGEVWLANAPGGLDKAVKVIFGFHNEKRAERELRSLEKIKEVRHPFLLSLERIEVVDGRLVIVTELADGSLKDRYEACVQKGLPGIPRDELLSYLRDTADALDFLNNKHSLQHLDIKPENLLLVAGHVKVADFGLVKRIQDTQASLVGGMTPLYAAPEVFQGTPSSFSDQYSLAILYQEMLTGQLPFDGVTSAELTLQHMHDEPNLAPLPMTDRYVLARALSKEPSSRFKSCSEMAQALINAGSVSSSPSTPTFSPSAQQVEVTPSLQVSTSTRPGSMTQVFEDDLQEDASFSDSMLFDVPIPQEPTASEQPPLELSTQDWKATPVLFLGIGGTAGHVLRHLKRRICDQYGETAIPAMQMLLLDTDSKAIAAATRCEKAGLLNEETVTLSLRRPQDYRDRSQHMLQWLSRRWLYNIPKSLCTEGLRPLGRLAFVDHARRTVQRIRLALSQATDTVAIEESQRRTGWDFHADAVRVYLVASISGGTGSGMSLDVSYALNTILQRLGIANCTKKGIFLHSTGQSSRLSDLAKVNAHSWLTEYNHFHRPDGYYPGDDACGLPMGERGVAAFDDTYLMHLGDGLTEHELEEQSDKIANYLYLDGLTAGQTFYDSSRQEVGPKAKEGVTLRTMQLKAMSSTPRQILEELAQDISRKILETWSGEKLSLSRSSSLPRQASDDAETLPLSKTDQVVCGAAQAVAQLQLNLQGIAVKAHAIIEKQFGANAEKLLFNLLNSIPNNGRSATIGELIQVVDGLFAALPEEKPEDKSIPYVMGRPLVSVIGPLCMKLSSDLQRWILNQLDDPQERLAGTREVVEWFAEHFERTEQESQRMLGRLRQQLRDAKATLRAREESQQRQADFLSDEIAQEAIRYFRLHLDQSTLEAAILTARTLKAELKKLREIIVEFGRHLRNLASSISIEAGHEPAGTRSVHATAAGQEAVPLVSFLRSQIDQFVVLVDRQLQEEYIDKKDGLFEAIMGSSSAISELLTKMNSLAFQKLADKTREFYSIEGNTTGPSNRDKNESSISSPLLKYGGITRQLLILPEEQVRPEHRDSIREDWGQGISLLANKSSDVTWCCEAGDIPLRSVAVDLIEFRRDYADFAARVHSRKDVAWSSLMEPTPGSTNNRSEVFVTEVLS